MTVRPVAGRGRDWRAGPAPGTGPAAWRPRRQRLPREAFDRIWADAVVLLALGVKANAIITVDGAKKSRRRYGESVNIFAKDHCPACAGAITAFEIAGRRSFACETCQPKF